MILWARVCLHREAWIYIVLPVSVQFRVDFICTSIQESEYEWFVLSYKTGGKALQDKFTKLKNLIFKIIIIWSSSRFCLRQQISRCSFPLPNVKAFQVIRSVDILPYRISYLFHKHNEQRI